MNPSDPEQPQADAAVTVVDLGRTTISEVIVAKLAALATREIEGVYRLSSGSTFADFTQRLGGSSQVEGVQAEVGQRETAIDVRLVTEYGASIPDVAQAVRQNIVARVGATTGLMVKEVNIDVVDLHFPGEEVTGGRKGKSSGKKASTETDQASTSANETVRLSGDQG